MTRTITALFDSRADAEAAKQRLQSASIGADDVHVHDQSSQGFSRDQYSSHQDRGFWSNVKSAFLPDEDRHTYEEGVRRGGALLTATVPEHQADDVVRILDEADAIDLEDRSNQWRQSGWDYSSQNTAATTGTGSAFAFGGGTGATTGDDYTRRTETGLGTSSNDERIPIVEEELKIGKREVERGGVRVRSYVAETPVNEQVTLRDEHVSIERRAVDQPLSAADGDAFREREISMTETAEEAVVQKEARVREELLIHKEVGQHTETIQDSVRHTEVDVDNLGERRTDDLGTRGDDDLTRRDRF